MRWFAVLGLALSLLLFVFWCGAWITILLNAPHAWNHPTFGRYEIFVPPAGAELRFHADGTVEPLKPGSFGQGSAVKFYLELTTVVVLFVVAASACVLLIRRPYAPAVVNRG